MTINGTENMTMRDSMGLKVDKRCKGVWCAEEAHLYPSATAFAEEKGTCLANVYKTLNGQQQTCKGLHISYEENVRETQQMFANRISTMNNERSEFDEMKQKAALWDAYQAEQEAARKAEEKRQVKIKMVERRLERHQANRDKMYQNYLMLIGLCEEDERQLKELKGENGNA